MLEKSSQFLSSDQRSEPKSLDVALIIAGVENSLLFLETNWNIRIAGKQGYVFIL